MLTAYTESAFQLKSASSPTRFEITIPRQNGSYDRSKNSKRPERHDRLATDDRTYTAEYLASASSVFFGQSSTYPRSLLWRILSRRKILEISSADFARSLIDKDVDYTLALEFQDQISPRGVSFCDAGDEKGILLFVLTQSNEVFEFYLQTTYFQDPTSIPQDLETWCAAVPASSLSIDHAFHLHAFSSRDVFVSFASGKVQHWRRDGVQQPWTHVNYDDKRWGSSLFSIVSRKGSPDIEFDGIKLAATTAYAMARTDKYLFTACLNHTLRIWHLQSGKLVDSRDLLDQARDIHDKVQLNPANAGYIQFLEGPNKHEQFLLTCSPLDGGQIKLWRVRNSFDDDTTQFSIEDMIQTSSLRLPDPDPTGSTVWSLSGLRVIFDKQSKDWQAWALWRNHNHHKAYSLNFNFADISNQWQQDWVEVSALPAKIPAPDFVRVGSQDITSRWLDFMFFPGRYSNAVLETALSQYVTAVNGRLASGQRNKSLSARMESFISAQVTLHKYNDDTADHDRLAIDTDQQWRQLWRIVETLNESRLAPLTLAIDPITGMVYLTMTDMCCAIRECSNLELLQKNTPQDLDSLQHISRSRWPYRKIPFNTHEVKNIVTFLEASQKFFSSFSPELETDFLQTLEEDLYMESETESPNRIVNFYNEIDFANAVSDDVEQEFYKNLSLIGGVEGISDGLYQTLFDLLSEHTPHRERKAGRTKTNFGVTMTTAGVLEQIIAVRHILLAMLATTIFVDETEQFNTADNFERSIELLKTIERDLWLATHYRPASPPSDGSPNSQISVLQSLFGNALPPQSTDHHPMPYVLTQHIRATFANVSGVCEASPDDAVYLQCNLLRHGDLQLATEFLKFQPSTPWSAYVKARLSLALSRFQEAASYFEQAAPKLSSKTALGQMTKLSSGLLSAQEASHFNNGLPSYYDHIASLFESQSAFSDATVFLQLALDSLENDKDEPAPNFKQSILLRLFSSEVKCSRFERAYDALVQFTDPVLQRASTIDLTDAMLDATSSLTDASGVVQQIQMLPLDSQPKLAFTIDQHIASLAKKQTTIPSAGGLWLSSSTVDYLSVLHALRLSRKDYRGAACVLFDRLRITQKSGRARSDPQAVALRHALLALINTMTCVNEDEAYIITNTSDDPRMGGTSLKRMRDRESSSVGRMRKRQRVVITLDDLRREYQQVLDRCSRIERGDFEFGQEDEEDEDEDEGVWEGSMLKVDKNAQGTLRLGNGDRMDLS